MRAGHEADCTFSEHILMVSTSGKHSCASSSTQGGPLVEVVAVTRLGLAVLSSRDFVFRTVAGHGRRPRGRCEGLRGFEVLGSGATARELPWLSDERAGVARAGVFLKLGKCSVRVVSISVP